MSQLNRPVSGPRIQTHEGAPAQRLSNEAQLRRAVACCLLWEDSFYESGKSISDRIRELVNSQIPAKFVMDLAIEAREQFKLRHVPLLLVRELLRYPGPKTGLAECIARVIQRPDELAELCALYWADSKTPSGGRRMLPRQLKRGLALAFQKFSPYQLAKYNRDNAVKLKDVLFMCHARPKPDCSGDEFEAIKGHAVTEVPAIDKPNYKRGRVRRSHFAQGLTWSKLIQDQLEAPDTWEVALSSGADKKKTFERLIREGKLGGLALLRNLRNMEQAGCDRLLIHEALLEGRGFDRVLPYRFIAAAKAAPSFEPDLDRAMQTQMESMDKLPGRTIVLVDGSGSMRDSLSAKSDLTRFDAACGLAILARGLAQECRVFIFSNHLREVPPRSGMALRDALTQQAEWASTYLGRAISVLNQIPYDRLIVVTDEQSHDAVPNPQGRGYILNVAGYQNSSARQGVEFGAWTTISGWSESSIRFIQEMES